MLGLSMMNQASIILIIMEVKDQGMITIDNKKVFHKVCYNNCGFTVTFFLNRYGFSYMYLVTEHIMCLGVTKTKKKNIFALTYLVSRNFTKEESVTVRDIAKLIKFI